MNGITFREGDIYDLPFLKKMVYEAIFWNPQSERLPAEEIFKVPEIGRLLDNWPQRPGDFSLIAVNEQGHSIGAIWYRHWTSDNPSFGYVDDETPELGIAVVSEFRGKGVGRALMEKIIESALKKGINKLSLSVDPNNFALQLYMDLGFKKVGENSSSWTMLKNL